MINLEFTPDEKITLITTLVLITVIGIGLLASFIDVWMHSNKENKTVKNSTQEEKHFKCYDEEFDSIIEIASRTQKSKNFRMEAKIQNENPYTPDRVVMYESWKRGHNE